MHCKIHCPYCITAYGFRELTKQTAGVFECPTCGHVVYPDDASAQCSCPRCRSMTIYIENARRSPFESERFRTIASTYSRSSKRQLS
jgi:transcription initiation factor IIE alpha subunit